MGEANFYYFTCLKLTTKKISEKEIHELDFDVKFDL